MRDIDRNQFSVFEEMKTPAILPEDTANLVEELQTAPLTERQVLLNQIARQIVEDPLKLRPLLFNLSVVNIFNPDLDPEEAREAIIGHTETLLAEGLDLDIWTPGRIANLSKAHISGSPDEQTEAIERVEAALFASPKTVNESIDLLYNTAWAMTATSNLGVQRELFSVLHFRKEWLPPTSPTVVHFLGGLFSDDEHLARFHAVLTALDYIGIFSDQPPTSLIKLFIDSSLSPNAPSSRTLAARILDTQRGRLGKRKTEALLDVYQEQGVIDKTLRHTDQTYLELAQRRERYELTHNIMEWPNSVIRSPNQPLRHLVMEKYGEQAFRAKWENRVIELEKEGYELQTQNPIQIDNDLSLVIIARKITSPEQRDYIVNEITETLNRNGQSPNDRRNLYVPLDRALPEARLKRGIFEYFDEEKNIVFAVFPSHTEQELGKLASIIVYHRPGITTEQFEAISQKSQEVRRQIQTLFTRSLGTRGYRVSFDPQLRKKDYQNVTFKYDKESGETRVSLTLAKQTYDIVLDRTYRIIPGGDVKKFASMQDQVWLELLLLTNLKKVLCTSNENLEKELTDGTKQVEALRKQRFYKSESMRWMRYFVTHNGHPILDREGKPKRPKYSPQQNRLFMEKATFPDMTEAERELGLQITNELRAREGHGGTPETGWWTYVQASERNDETITGPIKITFKENVDLNSVVPSTNAISPEELQRLYAAATAEVYEDIAV